MTEGGEVGQRVGRRGKPTWHRVETLASHWTDEVGPDVVGPAELAL